MIRTITVFAAGFLIDLAYVGWIRSIATDMPGPAAVFSMAIGACGLWGVTSVVKNRWLAVPYLLGLGAGTLVGMSL